MSPATGQMWQAAMAEETAALDIDDDAADALLADTDDAETPEKKPPTDTDQLGDAGKRALDAMKRDRNTARTELAALKERLQKYDDEGKSESQRLQEDRDTHKSRADKATNALAALEVALERAPEHATLAHVKAVAKRVRGDDADQLAEDADELFELLVPAPSTARTPSRPKERLKGGSEPDEAVIDEDPRKLAALVKRRI